MSAFNLESPSPPLRLGSPAPERVHIAVHLRPEERRRTLFDEARAGLSSPRKELSPKWLYDERGSRLFEEITRLPEYYPTRREREILVDRAGEIAHLARADTLVELGSGSSEKTRVLIEAMAGRGRLRRFVPMDVDPQMLCRSAFQLARDYSWLRIHGVVGDFERHLAALPQGEPRLIAFLGGTLGNLKPDARARFLGQLAAGMAEDDLLLLGADLIKDRRRLLAAYDDIAGVTAEFNRNVLTVLNRELGADFVPGRFRHRVRFDEEALWMEMLLVCTEPHEVGLRELSLRISFIRGEQLRTETSAKFDRTGIEAELAAAGLALERFWTDSCGDFALALARRG